MTAWILSCAALATLCCAGCGYSTGFSLPAGQTVGVEIFDNDSKERDIEAEVHVAVTDALDRMVGANLVDPRDADLIITGTVRTYARRGGIRNKDNERLENGVRITLEGVLIRRGPGPRGASTALKGRSRGALKIDAASGDQVLRQITINEDRGFLIEDRTGEADARARALRNLADRLVLDLFADLAYEARPASGPGS